MRIESDFHLDIFRLENILNFIESRCLFYLENYRDQFKYNYSEIQNTNSAVHSLNKIRLLILIHGFRGSSQDMLLIKGCLIQSYPDMFVLNSQKNENLSDCSIETQGYNLATEILNYVNHHSLSLSRLKISFIAHSLGGLIARAALPYLNSISYCFDCFITLSTPHLGIGSSENCLVNFGK